MYCFGEVRFGLMLTGKLGHAWMVHGAAEQDGPCMGVGVWVVYGDCGGGKFF